MNDADFEFVKNSVTVQNGQRSRVITVPTGNAGITSTFAVYNSGNITTEPSGQLIDYSSSGVTPFSDLRLANINGSSVEVLTGDPSQGVYAAENRLVVNGDNGSTLYSIDDASTVFYGSRTSVLQGIVPVNPVPPATVTSSRQSDTFAGTFTNVAGTFTVTDLASYRAYNDALIQGLAAGTVPTSQYTNLLAQGVRSETRTITYTSAYSGPTTITNLQLLPKTFALVDNSTFTLRTASELVGVRDFTSASPAYNTGSGLLIDAVNSARIVNSGSVAQNEDANGIELTASSLTNSGAIGIGYETLGTSTSGFATPQSYQPGWSVSSRAAINATNGAIVTNSRAGIVNVSNRDVSISSQLGKGNVGIRVVGAGSTGINDGTINVGGGAATRTYLGDYDGAAAVLATESGAFLNHGVIRLGSTFQAAPSQPVADTSDANYSRGLAARNGSVTNSADGLIRIGSFTSNAEAMEISGGGSLENAGTIEIAASAISGGVALPTYGIAVFDNAGLAQTAANSTSGVINVGGFNGSGIYISSSSNGATASNDGTINVTGGLDPVTGLRNFGVQAEGSTASVTLSGGNINLGGEGAIAVYAHDGGTITNSGTAVNFGNTGQVGYYALGTGSSATTTGGALNVSTANSTGYRLENGANFAVTAPTAIEVSGASSRGIVGSGASASPTVALNDTTLDLTGTGSAGVYVEGGATADLSGGQINLLGANTIAAIADGQRFNLLGEATGNPVVATRLESDLDLSSTERGVTGYLARNSASLTTTGDINLVGDGSTGIRAESGASGTNSGDLTIGGFGSRGLVAQSASLATTVNQSADVNVAGGSVSDRSIGVISSGAAAAANLDSGTLNLTGAGAIGAAALDGGTVSLAGGIVPNFGNTDQIGFYASGVGSRINVAATGLDVTTRRSALFRLDDGATLDLRNDLGARGVNSIGVLAEGTDTTATVSGGTLIAGAAGSRAIEIRGGAAGTIEVGAVIDLAANNAVGGVVDGSQLDLDGTEGTATATSLMNRSDIISSTPNVIGFVARNQGVLQNNGSIQLDGLGSVGVSLEASGMFDNRGTVLVDNGTGVRVRGAEAQLHNVGSIEAANGTAAIDLEDQASLELDGSSGTITSAGTADGIRVSPGAVSLAITGGTVVTSGSGNAVENAGEISTISLDDARLDAGGTGSALRTSVPIAPMSNGLLLAQGAGATAFNLTSVIDTPVATDLVLASPGLNLMASGTGASGLRLNTTGSVSSAATITVTSSAGGPGIEVVAASPDVINLGSVSSASSSSPTVVLDAATTFTNRGIIEATASGSAINGNEAVQQVQLEAGRVTGNIQLGDGSDTFLMTGGTLNGSLQAGLGNDTAIFRGLSNEAFAQVGLIDGGGAENGKDSLIFDGTQEIGTRRLVGWNNISLLNGSVVSADGDLVLAGSNLTVGPGSTYEAGGFNSSVVSSGSDVATLVNAGTISLTNGTSSQAGNSLTIDGNYVGQGGVLRLDTVVGRDNAPSDYLVVDGGTASGSTTIDVNAISRPGGGTSNNGILLVDAINSAATEDGAFSLAGGSVSAGAYNYELFKGGVGGDASQSWFLRSSSSSGTPLYRPEAAVYAAVGPAAYLLGITALGTFNERQGDQYLLKGSNLGPVHTGWGRIYGEDLQQSFSGTVDPEIDGALSGAQVGLDLLEIEHESGHRDHLGIFAGQSSLDVDVRGLADGLHDQRVGDIKLNGTSFGMYETHMAPNGWYVDTVLMGMLLDGNARSNRRTGIDVKGTEFTTSVESGYPISLGRSWTLEPQGQLTWQKLDFEEDSDRYSTIRLNEGDQLTGRLGVRAAGLFRVHDYDLRPYAAIHLWHGFSADDKVALGDDEVKTHRESTSLEPLVGGTAKISDHVSLYGEVAYKMNIAGHNEETFGGNAGIRITW